jgi:O-antigen/teichoic acid export membrane protein
MSLYKELLGGTLNYGLSKFIPQLIGFLLIPVYTNVLEPDDYGLLEVCTVVAAALLIFMRMGLTGSIFRFYYDKTSEPEQMNDYVTTMHRLIIGTSLVTGIVFLVIGYFVIEQLIRGLAFWPFFVLIIFTIILNSNSEIQKRLIQAKRQAGYMRNLNIVFSLISISLVLILVVVFRFGVIGYLIAGFVGAVIFYFQAQHYLRKYLTGRFNVKMALQGLNYGIKVLPSHIVTPTTQVISRVILGNVVSLASVGIFSLANRFLSPLTVIAASFQTAFNPLYFEFRNDPTTANRMELENLVKVSFSISILLYVLVSVFGPVFIILFTPDKYHEASKYIGWIAISFILGSINIFYSAELYYSKVKFVPIISLARLVVNVGLSVLLIYWSDLGTIGLIVAVLGEGLISVLLTILGVKRTIPIRFPLRRYFYLTIAILLIVLGGRFFLDRLFINQTVNLIITFGVATLIILKYDPVVLNFLSRYYKKLFKVDAQ